MINIKNIFLGILVIALASLLIGSASAAFTSDPDISATDEWTIDEDIASTITITSDNVNVTHYADNATQFDITAEGVITWTPTNDDVGSFSVQVDALNATEVIEESYTFTVTVNNTNDAPTWDLDNGYILTENIPFTLDLIIDGSAEDIDNDPLIFTADTADLPIGDFTWTEATGVLTINTDNVGVYDVKFTMTDNIITTPIEKVVRFRVLDEYEDGQLEIDSIDIENLDGDDDHIYPGHTIEITIEVENDGNQDIEDITLSIYNDDLNIDEEYDFDLDEGDSEDIIFEVQVPYDADDKEYDLDVYVKGKGDEDDEYHSDYYYDSYLSKYNIDIDRGTHDVIVSKLKITPSEIDAGDTVTVTVEVTNIGKRDEEDVTIRIYNDDLDISEYSDEFDLDTDDDKSKTFEIVIPETAEDGDYIFEAIITYDDDSSDEDDTPLTKSIDLTVTGGTPTTTVVSTDGDATLTATTTTANAIVGKAIKYDFTLTNNADETQTYTVDISGVTDWATYIIEAGGETDEVSIPAGKSVTVYVYLTPETDATSGEHTATVSINSGGELIDSQVLTTTVAGGTTIGTTLTGSAISFRPSDSTVNWMIIGAVIVLTALIFAFTVYKIKMD